VLFYGNTLPTLENFTGALTYATEPTLSLSGNNVIIDHPEYVTQFQSYQFFDGQFDFTACSNITIIYSNNVNKGAKVYGCGNLTNIILANVNTSYIEDIDFTGCTSLVALTFSACNITNINFLDTTLNKSILLSLNLYNNDITTVDLTDFTHLEFVSFYSNNNLSSLLVDNAFLRSVYASNTALTSLDLSSSLTYEIINIGSSNISTLTIANGTANEGTSKSYYDLSNNDLSTESLDAFFTALGAGNTFKKNKKQVAPFINVQGNPGAEFCDPTIATAKGWSVYTGF